MNELTGITLLLLLLLLFCTGIELGFAMAVIGFIGFAYLKGFALATNLIARDLFDVMTNYGYTVFPLFMLMGQIGFLSGMAKNLYDAAHKFIGHIPGGLAMATVVGGTRLQIHLRILRRHHCHLYQRGHAGNGPLRIRQEAFHRDRRARWAPSGCLIPPSVVLIIYGIITEQSIGKLFMAGLIPALIISVFFVGIIYGWARSIRIAPVSEPSSWKVRARALPPVVFVLLIFVLIDRGHHDGLLHAHGGRFRGGLCRPGAGPVPEGAQFQKIRSRSLKSIRTGGMFLMLIAGSLILGHFIAVTNIPQASPTT